MKKQDIVRFKENARRYSIDELYAPVKEASPRNPADINVKTVTPRVSNASPGQTELSEVDLSQIGQAYYSDAYISRAINKITGLMFKAGWGFSSLNKDALSYVQTRFRLIEESTHVKTEELLRDLGLNFVLYGNAVIVKARGQENLDKLKAEGHYGGEPISALFTANPEFFTVSRDEFGNIESYSIGETNSAVEFKKEDIEHLTYQKPSGRAYGVPYITNSLRDVLILRQVEETVTNILYRNLHPLQVYKVGLDKAGFEAQEGEIEIVREAVQSASLDSMFILPERHNIETISSGSDFLDANGYLKYFRQRVFTGLGVSESVMGIGDSSNRSTSDNQSSDLIDLVKDFQQNFSSGFQKVLDEILFEGGYDPTINEEDRVEFVFTEIEQSAKIARENHEMQKFLMNVQSLDEARRNMGYEPTTDFSNYYANLFSTASPAEGTVKNNAQPENQHGTTDTPASKENAANKSILNAKTPLTEANLTNNPQAVILPSDNELDYDLDSSVKAAWEQTIRLYNEHSNQSLFLLNALLIENLPNSLFENQVQKADFTLLIAKQAYPIIDSFGVKSNRLYQYDKSILGSYHVFNESLEKEELNVKR